MLLHFLDLPPANFQEGSAAALIVLVAKPVFAKEKLLSELSLKRISALHDLELLPYVGELITLSQFVPSDTETVDIGNLLQRLGGALVSVGVLWGNVEMTGALERRGNFLAESRPATHGEGVFLFGGFLLHVVLGVVMVLDEVYKRYRLRFLNVNRVLPVREHKLEEINFARVIDL